MSDPTEEEILLHMGAEGKVLANGHIYKIYFAVGADVPDDRVIAAAVEQLGAVKIQHVTDGGVNVAVTPTLKKENA